MKFKAEIVERILAELEKIPNIRYVCTKVGIDHSTFYRWIMRYPSFNKRVMQAIFMGKRAICGTAETVIIKGVQNGDFRAATFYLTHNDPDYMQKDKGEYFDKQLDKLVRNMKAPIEHDGSNFETLFDLLYELEKNHSKETSERIGKRMVEFFCNNESQLIELFYASYEHWKLEQKRKDQIENGEIPEADPRP